MAAPPPEPPAPPQREEGWGVLSDFDAANARGAQIPVSADNEVLHNFPVRRETTDRAVQAPAMNVPPDCTVTVQPLSGNAATAYYSTVSPEAAAAGFNRVAIVTNANPYRVSVRNLSEIFVYSGTVGEGLLVTVLRARKTY